MSVRIKTVSGECGAVNHALAWLGKLPILPPKINDRTADWRRIALLSLGGQVDGIEVRRADILQACGQINGVIYQTVKRDNSGRPVTSFHGDAGTCWRPFEATARRMVGINTKGKL